MITIDGNTLLGSGQLVRTALALAAITKTSLEIINIRSKRSEPGLKAQHYYAIQVLKKLTHATTKDLKLGSTKVTFIPKELTGEKIKVDIGTAGSITLLIQNILLPLMFADKKSKIKIQGGTDVQGAPTITYLEKVILPFFNPYAKQIKLTIKKYGFYPKGMGEVTLEVTPKYTVKEIKNKIQPLTYIKPIKIEKIEGFSLASLDLKQNMVAERQKKEIELKFGLYLTNIKTKYVPSMSPGSSITLWASSSLGNVIGADSLGKKGIPAESVARVATTKLEKELRSTAPIDEHMADNLIPLMALFPPSTIKTSEISDHTKTNIWVTEQILPVVFEIKDTTITCRKL